MQIEDKIEFKASMNMGDYYKKYTDKQILRLDDYSGNSIEERIISFFNWFKENIDEKMINIIKGTDWVDLIVDWRERLDRLRRVEE